MFWLILAFSWGIYRLIVTIYVAKESNLPIGFDDNSGDWTFGQVVALVLLVAPLITIVESYDKGNLAVGALNFMFEFLLTACAPEYTIYETSAPNPENNVPLSSSLQMTHLPVARPNDNVSNIDATIEYPEDPDNDWQFHTQTLGVATLYALMISVGWAAMLLMGAIGSASLLSWFFSVSKQTIAGSFSLTFVGYFGVVIFSLMIETLFGKQQLKLRIALQAVNLVFFGIGYILVVFPMIFCPALYASTPMSDYCYEIGLFRYPDKYGFGFYWNLDIFGLGLYALCVLVCRAFV